MSIRGALHLKQVQHMGGCQSRAVDTSWVGTCRVPYVSVKGGGGPLFEVDVTDVRRFRMPATAPGNAFEKDTLSIFSCDGNGPVAVFESGCARGKVHAAHHIDFRRR